MVTTQRINEINEIIQDTGLIVTWDADKEVFTFQLSDTNKETVDQWWHLLQTLAYDWDTTQPFNAIYEFSDGAELMTNYARQMVTLVANEVGQLYPELHGRLAIVIPPTAQARFLRVFVQTLIYSNTLNFDVQIFNNRDAALRWIAS